MLSPATNPNAHGELDNKLKIEGGMADKSAKNPNAKEVMNHHDKIDVAKMEYEIDKEIKNTTTPSQ